MIDNLTALKNLAVVVCGVKIADVKGTTTAEVIQFIAEHFPKPKK